MFIKKLISTKHIFKIPINNCSNIVKQQPKTYSAWLVNNKFSTQKEKDEAIKYYIKNDVNNVTYCKFVKENPNLTRKQKWIAFCAYIETINWII